MQKAAESAPRVEPLSRLTTGSEVYAILNGAHFSRHYNDEPENEEEVDLVSGFFQQTSDWGDLDLEPGERVRAGFHIGELIDDLERAGWFVFGKRDRRRLTIAGQTSTWSVAVLAVVRGADRKVALVDGEIGIAVAPESQ